jgi:MoaA/NifB/PqqE/SkfB family radical SAM enzyme
MNNTILKPAPWTAWRTYRTAAKEVRSIIANEKDHTKVFLDAESAELWNAIEKGISYQELHDLAKQLDVADELDLLLAEFQDLGLLVNPDSKADNTPLPVPTAKPLEFAENIKPENEFQSWVMAQGFMYSTHWELTYRCNERCVHCYNPGAAHSDSEKPDRVNNELSTEQVIATLKRLAEGGVFNLTLSGGEIMLRKDFFEIVAAARQLGMAVNVYTNGLKLDEAAMNQLCDLWPSTVSFSIYSHIPKVHDDITRVAGSFDKTVNALKAMNERGIRTSLKSVQMSHTLRSYTGTLNLAKELNASPETEIGLSPGVDGAIAPMLMSTNDPKELILAAMTEGFPIFVGTAENNYGEFVKDKKATVCAAGYAGLNFSADGSIYPCNSLTIKSGNLHTDDPLDIWHSALSQRVKITDAQKSNLKQTETTIALNEVTKNLAAWQDVRLEDYEECSTHLRCRWCTKCPGMALMETGRALAPSTTNCRTANARMFAALLLRSGETHESVAEVFNLGTNYGSQQPSERPEIPEPSRGTDQHIDPRKSAESLKKSDETDQSQTYITPNGETWLKYGSKWNVQSLKAFEPIRAQFKALQITID